MANEYLQAAFLQRGQDGLAALSGGACHKGIRGHLQEVTAIFHVFRLGSIFFVGGWSSVEIGLASHRWLHPFLCDKEEEIDAVLQRVKEQVTVKDTDKRQRQGQRHTHTVKDRNKRGGD